MPGSITTVATASLLNPQSVAVDSSGNIYIADTVNQVVRRVTTNPSGGAQSDVVVAGVFQSAGQGGDGGLAVNARLNTPAGIAFDSTDNLYIADQANNQIRKVDRQTGIITTVAGSGVPCAGSSSCFADGSARNATLNGPMSLAFDANNGLYFSDSYNNVIRKVDVSLDRITTVAGDGSDSKLSHPAGIALDNAGNLYMADTYHHVIRKVALSSADKSLTVVAGCVSCGPGFGGDDGWATNAKLNSPIDVRLDQFSNIYIADSNNNRVRVVNAKTGVISTLVANSGDVALSDPMGLSFDRQGRFLYVADTANNLIRRINMTATSINAELMGSIAPQLVGTTSSYEIKLTSSSNDAVGFLSAPVSSMDFEVSGNDCGSTLAPGLSCSIWVVFSPQQGHVGRIIGYLNYSDLAGNAPGSVALTGISLSGQIFLRPPVFGNIVLNSATVTGALTLTNSGNSTLYPKSVTLASGDTSVFSVNAPPCLSEVAPGASCEVAVQFSPKRLGTQTAVVSAVTSASVDPELVSVTATVVGVPQAVISTGGLNFGSLTLNVASAQQAVSLGNSGTAPLTVSGVGLTGTNAGDFSVVNSCNAAVNPGGSCTVAIGFRPTGVGTRSALLSIGTGAGSSPQAVTLTGQGLGAPGAAIDKTQLAFSYQNLGTASALQNVTLVNPGNVPLSVSSAVLSGANAGDFAMKNGCGSTVLPGTSCVVSVSFTPSANGKRSASLVINTAVGPQTIALSGVGSGNYSVPGCTVLSFVAGPNPIYTNNPFGITSINANVTCPYEIRIGSPDGPLFATGSGYSSTLTGNWVTSGLSFFLQQSGNATPSGTLANLTVQVKTGQGCIATAFTASPNPIVTNNPYGKTTITAATNCSFDIRIGAPDGPEFQEGRGYSVLQTGDWVTNQMTMYLQPHGSTSPADTLSVLTLLVQPAIAGCTAVDFSAAENPIITTSRLNVATIRANANCPYDVRIGSPGGAVLGSAQGAVALQTGNWVVNGLSFYMQQRGVTSSGGTMATFTINTKLPDQIAPNCKITKFAADPNPLGAPGGSTNVSVNAGCAWDLRVGDAAGPLLTSGNGAGSATASAVANGTLLYLQPQGNTDWQRNLAILRISAGAQPSSCTALVFSSTPIVADSAFGTTNITADATCPYDIRINSPDGALFGSAQGLFSANTGNWVIFGQVFYLQRRGDITPVGTLATNAAIIIP